MAGQLWGSNTLGGYMYSDELSDILRTSLQPMARFRQFCDIKEGKGESKGDKLYWNVYSNVQTQGAKLTENVAMPETNYTIRQESLTVEEYGNSIPYSKKLDDLSKHSVIEVIHKVLKNDARNTLEKAAYDEFAKTKLTVTPVAGTSTTNIVVETTGTPTATNDTPLSKSHVKAISDEMKERSITPYDGENYAACGRPSTFRPFKNELEDIHKYVAEGFGMILNGEIGRYESIRFTEQTGIASKAWTNGKSDEAFFFGADTVAEGIVIPEEIRGKIPSDFGRSKGVAWYYLGGFGICHTAAEHSRILRWGSAA